MIGRDPRGGETWLLSLPPTRRQTRWVIAVAFCQVAALALLAPFASIPLAQINGFVPVVGGVIFVTDLVTAVLLFSQFAIHLRPALLILACGYLLSALMVISYTLTVPGAFSATGLLGAGLQTAGWSYWFWHLPFALALLGYGLTRDKESTSDPIQASSLAVIVRSVALVLALAGGLTLLATTGHDYLPVLFADNISRVRPLPTQGVALITTLVCVSALAALWLRRRSLLDQWLMVVALAAILEIGLGILLTQRRFDLGFYAGRAFSLLTSTIVLVILLVETTRLYAQVARSNESRIRLLVDANIIGIVVADLEGEIVEANDEFLRIIGYDRADLASSRLRWNELTPPDWRERDARTLAELNSTGTAQPFEKEYVRKDGSRVPVLIGAALFKEGGNEGVAFVLDLTERKRAEGALKHSETRYQNLFQAMAVSFFELDYTSCRPILRALRDAGVQDFRGHFKQNPHLIHEIMRTTYVVDVNDQTVALFGRGNKEELLTSVEEFWPEESLDDYVEAVLATIAGNDKFSTETRVRRLDGTIFDALFTLRYVSEDKTRGLAGVIDITERKRAENALRKSEERFRDYAETASDWLWEMGPDHKLTMLSPNAFGSSPSARLGTAAWERALDLETEPGKWRAIQATMDSHEPFRDFVYLAAGYDGSPMYVRASGKPVFDADGEFLGYRGVGTDATAIIRAQEALRESEQRLRAAIDGIPGLVAVLAPNGDLEAVNRQIVEYCGQPLEELRNWEKNGIVQHEDLPHVAEVFSKSIASGIPYRIEQRLRRFDGAYRWFDNRGIPVRDESGRIVRWYVLLTDIEERNHALAQLQQMQADFARMNRVSVMGELTASLSHEITQPIASARNNARAAQNFMKMQPPDLDEVREALACVVGDTDRARDIIDRIRDHIKKAPPRKELFDLNAAINEVIVLSRSLTSRNGVSVQTRLLDGLDPVLGDRVQLQQVLLNLVLNAAEAMGSIEQGTRDLLISTEQNQGGVRVSVRDTGPGIDSTLLDRVFDAFYTTKSSGTGMGLSICRSIIDAHGGKLWAEANEPRGAVFQFTLPGAEAEFTNPPRANGPS
jgi:PAS domain S-box-containing protein